MEVVGIGAATLDDLWLVPEFSPNESVLQASAHVRMGGGPVATALCVLAKLGRQAALIDCCGDDPAADSILSELNSWGVSTQFIQRTPKATSAQASVLVRERDGARQIVYLPSSAPEPSFDQSCAKLITRARLLHINGRHELVCREAVKVAQQHDVLISFDGGAGRYRDSLRDLVEASHLRILSADFARQYTHRTDMRGMLEELFKPPALVVVITEGESGSHAWLPDRGRVHHQPAIHAGQTLDTTGCGDVYHGAFIHQWLRGDSIEGCMESAARLAGANATGLGGRHACQRL